LSSTSQEEKLPATITGAAGQKGLEITDTLADCAAQGHMGHKCPAWLSTHSHHKKHSDGKWWPP